jgi:peroxiredoxin
MTIAYHDLPPNLPVPPADGACDHLPGMSLPALALPATAGPPVDLSTLPGRAIVYCYPMTGLPGTPLPEGWDMIPGARGCTPQSCGFRDHHGELAALGATVYGLSTQTTAYQQEMAERLHLPFPVLSDAAYRFTDALRLPTFVAGSMRLIKRLTLVVNAGRIEHVFYPVFPPDRSAEQVLAWLAAPR